MEGIPLVSGSHRVKIAGREREVGIVCADIWKPHTPARTRELSYSLKIWPPLGNGMDPGALDDRTWSCDRTDIP